MSKGIKTVAGHIKVKVSVPKDVERKTNFDKCLDGVKNLSKKKEDVY